MTAPTNLVRVASISLAGQLYQFYPNKEALAEALAA
jgi:hypothetical protein